MQFKKLLNLGLILLAVNSLKAQTTVIDYSTLSAGSCNRFSSATVINGITHRSTIGQPKFGTTADPLVLEAQAINTTDNPYGDKYSGFAIQNYNFQAGHQYKFTINARVPDANTALIIDVSVNNNSVIAVTNCNGPELANSSTNNSGNTNYITSTYYTDVFVNYTPSVNTNTAFIFLRPDALYSSKKTAYVKKITIEDLTPPTPTFTLSSSASSKACGTQLNNVTFTVANPSGATITGYKFYPQSGSYLYNGSPAPTEIATSSNSITLTAMQCAGTAPVYAKVGWNGQDVQTNSKTFTVTTPDLYIQGPDTRLVNEAGFYDVQGLTSTPINYNWPCSHFDGWSSSVPSLTAFYNTTPYTTYFYASSGALNTTVTITASVSMCGVSKNVSKDVRILSPRGRVNKSLSNDKTLLNIFSSPNPSKGIFTIQFNKILSDAVLTVISIDGRTILNKKVYGLVSELDLTAFQSGIYILKVNDGENIVTQKIVKD